MGGFFAGLAGGLASGYANKRDREYQIEKEDRDRRTAAYTHILENPNATPEAREYAFTQISAIGEGTDGKKNAKPSPVMQILKPLLDRIHGASSAAAPRGQTPPILPGSITPDTAANSSPAGAIPPPPGSDQQATPAGIGVTQAMLDSENPTPAGVGVTQGMLQGPSPATAAADQGGGIPPVPGAPADQSVSGGQSPAGGPGALPSVPGTTAAAKGGRPSHLFYTPEEIAKRQNDAALARFKGQKQAELQAISEAIPAKIAAAEKAKGQPLSKSEKQTLINAEFGIHNYGRAAILRDVDGAEYGQPGQVGIVVRNPMDGSEEFVATKPKTTAAEAARQRLVDDYMRSNNVDRPTAEKAVSDDVVKKTKGTADAAANRPAVQNAVIGNLGARTNKTNQDSNAVFAKLESDKNAKLSSITADYSKRRLAVQNGKLSDSKKQQEVARLNDEETSQRKLAEDNFQRRVSITKGNRGTGRNTAETGGKATTKAKVQEFAAAKFGGDYNKALKAVQDEGYTVK